MADTRSYDSGFKLVDFTDEINEIENQYGFINAQGYFSSRGVAQTAIVFDRNQHEITLLPEQERGDRQASKGKDRTVDTFSLPLTYFKHQDRITVEDIQGWRQAGTKDQAQTLANVRAEKLVDMRLAADQSLEYMKLQAMKGAMKTPNGRTVADMFSLFNITQKSIDFDLGTDTTDVDAKIAEMKRHIAKEAKTGGTIQGVDVFVDPMFFDKLINHPKIREAYQAYLNSGAQRLRDDLSSYMTWGIVDVFEHRGVRFMTYDAVFLLPDGTSEQAIADNTGHAVPRGLRDLFRGYYGPSNKLSGANRQGAEMYAFEYTDPRDEYHDLELEMAPLFFATKPNVLVEVTTST